MEKFFVKVMFFFFCLIFSFFNDFCSLSPFSGYLMTAYMVNVFTAHEYHLHWNRSNCYFGQDSEDMNDLNDRIISACMSLMGFYSVPYSAFFPPLLPYISWFFFFHFVFLTLVFGLALIYFQFLSVFVDFFFSTFKLWNEREE